MFLLLILTSDMLRSTHYSNIRTKMFADNYSDFDNLDDEDKFILLMRIKDYDCILPIINFVNSAFEQCKSVDI